MKCADARELLSAFVDNALDPAEAADVRAHLDACEPCRARLAELESVVGLVREIPDPRVPEGFAVEVVARLPRRRVPTPIRWLAPLAAAACLLLVVKIGFFSDDESSVRHVAESKDASGEQLDVGMLGKEAGDAGSAPGAAFDEEASGYRSRETAPGRAVDGSEEMYKARVEGPAPDAASAPEPEPVTEAPESEGAPAPAKAERARVDGRRYAVQGAEPDTAAGVILAELRRKRTREARGGEPAGERVVQDRAGDVSGMLLFLTPGELEFVTCLLEERPGVRVAPVNGIGKKADRSRDAKGKRVAGDEDDAGGERLRVELRFR